MSSHYCPGYRTVSTQTIERSMIRCDMMHDPVIIEDGWILDDGNSFGALVLGESLCAIKR